MKQIKHLILAAALALPLSAVTANAIAAGQAHDHAQANQMPLQLNAGQKWETDAPLRQGMDAIYGQVTQALPKAHANAMSPADYDALASAVNDQFTYIVQNCSLKGQADAQLHIVLGNMSQGAEIARGKEKGHERADGLLKIAQTLNAYGDHFSHDGWKKIDLAH